jgi:hypothetical protein
MLQLELEALVGALHLLLHHKEIILFLVHQFPHLQQIQQLLLVEVMGEVENMVEQQVVLVEVVV